MLILQASSLSMSVSPQYAVHNASTLQRFLTVPIECQTFKPSCYSRYHSHSILPNLVHYSYSRKLPCLAVWSKSNSEHDPEPNADSKVKQKPRSRSKRSKALEKEEDNDAGIFPTTIPRKPRRGRRSEAAALEDYVRNTLEQTFASIRQQNAEVMENKENVIKEKVDDKVEFESSDDEEEDEEEEIEQSDGAGRNKKKKMVVEEEDPNWPLDADVGWGVRASEYFEQHPIKNIVGDDGVEIDWEGEIEDNWVQEINCLEWESFAFHPSPLIVLVFERYNRATDNWKTLKELEKALQVYWNAKDRLPPRSVKIDINIERDLAYALKVRECPQILFLRGNKVLYREKDFRTADELVQMIAFFYYKAKKPSWINDKALSRPF
ncbi:thioredoxin-like fold domain-containing protein MRL7, chloroplastic [Benincasa hispida]|uniref:thioredoxin-like fold domain-containing protein MRL7, chloroplastic n=1 Tax=Benincasa hispida TaxID=102211 RepID=UPI0019009116|nr:thioredoxin-like fold domain-containing protein MRL7, chloroplastic [Benincasa hispida]XP_038888100.1 thioredoxin-like fold domain-containing protein MRL7, chloroplastic [Benincasa hispida]XP_038888101.1 thioredoxin-like fold domain-containing protein MRL7, chloroplastic [Benincasa hispida]XP_038888102.1 thioredoxin-like fold domain-containing protein MRL7, chloroplastic [Benincasa hispida]XP_038888103.1 thioredoxin-like fold domain-containing protein MRL7, chloroplastic [Benincasa hispida]